MKDNKFYSKKIPPFAKDNNGAAFYWRIRNIQHARMLAIIDMLTEYDLHYTQPPVLGLIDRLEEPTQKDLADAMNTSQAAMSATVKRMEKSGMVERKSTQKDSRKKIIKLTAKGKQIHKDTFGKTLEIDRALMRGFTESEVKQLFEYLDRIQINAETVKEGNNI